MMMRMKKLLQSKKKRCLLTTDSILNRLYPLWTAYWNRMIRSLMDSCSVNIYHFQNKDGYLNWPEFISRQRTKN